MSWEDNKFQRIQENKSSFASGKAIAILWGIEDVRAVAESSVYASELLPLSDEDAIKILANVERLHDASIGINWDVIRCHVDDFYSSK